MTKFRVKKIIPKLIFFSAVIAVSGAIIAYVAVKKMFTPRAVKSAVLNRLQETFKRPVTLNTAKFSFSGKIRITNIRVFPLRGESEDFMTADVLYASYNLSTLLTKKLSINKFYFESPKINLIKRKDGTWNFSNMFKGGKGKKLIRLKEAKIENGEIKIKNLEKGVFHTFKNVNFWVSNFKPQSETPFGLSGKIDVFADSRLKGTVYCEGRLNAANFGWEKASLKDVNINLTFLGKPINARLSLENFKSPKFNISFEIPKMNTFVLKPLIKTSLYFNIPRLTGNITGNEDNGKISILSSNLKTKNLNLNSSGNIAVSSEAFKYALSVFSKSFPLKEINAIFPSFTVKSLLGKGQFKISANNSSDEMNFTHIFANTENAGFKYKSLKISGLNSTALLQDNMEKSKFYFKAKKIKVAKSLFSDISLNTKLKQNSLSSTIKGNWDMRKFKALVNIAFPFTQNKELKITVSLKKTDVKKLKESILTVKDALFKKKRKKMVSSVKWVNNVRNSIPSGYKLIILNAKSEKINHEYFKADNFYISSKLKNFSGDVAKIRGNVAIKAENGVFFKVQETSQKDRIYNIVAMPILLMFKMNRFSALKIGATLKDVYFNAIGGEYSLDMGKIHIKNFFMDGKDFSAYSTGDIDLINETIRLKVYTISTKYYTMGTLPQLLTDESGKPALAFLIKGKMKHPDLKMLNPRKTGEIIEKARKKGVAINKKELDAIGGI